MRGHFPGLAGSNVHTVFLTNSGEEYRLFGQIEVGQLLLGRLALLYQHIGLGHLVFGYAGGLFCCVKNLDGIVILLLGIVLNSFIITHVE